jgi:host factor-I protein
MPQERPRSLQDTFLAYVQDQNVPVTVFLVNGVRLQGFISRFDRYGVTITRDGHTQLVYKHAISAINPLVAIQLFVEVSGEIASDQSEPAT